MKWFIRLKYDIFFGYKAIKYLITTQYKKEYDYKHMKVIKQKLDLRSKFKIALKEYKINYPIKLRLISKEEVDRQLKKEEKTYIQFVGSDPNIILDESYRKNKINKDNFKFGSID